MKRILSGCVPLQRRRTAYFLQGKYCVHQSKSQHCSDWQQARVGEWESACLSDWLRIGHKGNQCGKRTCAGVRHVCAVWGTCGRRDVCRGNALRIGADCAAFQCVSCKKLLSNGGCLVSEYPPLNASYSGIGMWKETAFKAESAMVCSWIEAASDSGTMHTVRYAIRQGRSLACIDSRLVRYHSGNQWIAGQNGAYVIRGTGIWTVSLQRYSRRLSIGR